MLREYLEWTNKDGADLTEAARWLRLHTDSKDTAKRIWPDFSKGVQDYFRSDDVNESLQDEFYADERTEAGDRRPSGSVLNEVYSTEAPELNEAFKAGNRARKKESAQENAESVDTLQAQIDRFNKETGNVYKDNLEIRNGKPYYEGYLYLYGDVGLTGLPSGLTVSGNLQLSGCTNLTSLPPGLFIAGDLFIGGTGLTSIPADMIISLDNRIVFGKSDTELKYFFKKLNIPIWSNDNSYFVHGYDWKFRNQMTEAFKAGNRARKKESSQENVADISDMKLDGLKFCQRIYSYAVNELGIDALLITDYSRLQALRGLINYSEEEYPIVVISRSSNDEFSLGEGQFDESLTPDEFITISATDEYFIAELVLNSIEPADGPDDRNPGKYDMRGQSDWMKFWNFKPWKDKFEEMVIPAGMVPKLTDCECDEQTGLKYWKLNANNLAKMMNALKKYAEDGAGADDIPGFIM